MLASLLLLPPAAAAPLTVEAFSRAEPGPGWARWGRPMGEAAGQCSWSVARLDKAVVGQVVYRRARGTVLVPMPEVNLTGRPVTLAMRVLGDGQGALLGVTVLDANGEWLATPGLPVTWRGWRSLSLDLRRVARSSRGDEDGLADPPVTLWTFNIEFGLPLDGSLAFGDMTLAEEPWKPFDYLDTALDGPALCRVYRPEDRAPRLALVNRSAASLPVVVDGTVAGEPVHGEVLINPRSDGRLDLPKVKASGPAELLATVGVGRDKRELRYRYGVLPLAEAPPDSFFGLGRYNVDDLLDGRLLRELPDLRSASAGWTLVRLQRSLGEAALSDAEWTDAASALAVAQAFGLRLLAEAPAEWLLRHDLPGSLVGQGLDRFAPYLDGCLVDARYIESPALVAAAARAARAALPEGRRILVRGAAAPDDCEARLVDLPLLLEPPAGPFPRAWRAIASLLDGGDTRPGWLMAEFWPGGELSGARDPAASAALMLIAARCVPRLEAAALGRLQGRDGEQVLLRSAHDLSEPFLAWAVAARMLAGLESQGVRELAPRVYQVEASGARRLRIVWSEGEPLDLSPEVGEAAYDLLGRRLAEPRLSVGAAPVYLVRAVAAPAPLR